MRSSFDQKQEHALSQFSWFLFHYASQTSPLNSILQNNKVKCLGVTKNGNPKHISRLGYDTELIDYKI